MRIGKAREITPDMERLITLIRNKGIILWAGSGLSLYAGYPSGTEFCDIICNAAKSESDKAILARHKSVLMNIAEEFEQLYSRDELIGLVSAYFDKAPSVKPYAHYLCTQIPQIDTIITTNYDHLFEYAYGDNLCTVVGTQYKASDKKPVTLYKIHGDSSDSASVVLTSKDYAKFYEGLNSLIWNKLKVILAEHSVLFIGYSLEDKNIEDIFEKVLSQVDTSESEFFIAVPTLAEHKLRHFNTICKTTHIPIDGETLSSLDKGKQKTNSIIGCQPYTKHRFQQNRSGVFVCVLDIVTRSAPARFHRSVHGVSAGFIPRRRATHSTAGAACQGATGDISSRAAPFPWIGKGRGDRVEPLLLKSLSFHG